MVARRSRGRSRFLVRLGEAAADIVSAGMSTTEEQLDRQRSNFEEDHREHPKTKEWKTTIGGDCPLLRDYLANREGTGWSVCKLLVSYIRGFSQTAFANNPITGVILMVAVASVAPATFAVCSATSFLGHLISMLLKEPAVNTENGLTVFNPLIFGAVSYYFVPIVYGGFDGFSTLMMLLGVIFICYFWRACENGCIPCLTMPFNLAELILLFTLKNAHNQLPVNPAFVNETFSSMDNGTAIAEADQQLRSIVANAAVVSSLDWGMVVRATVTSASQLFVVNSVPLGAIVYLAVLIYSPITCLFGFLGSLGASLVALQVGAPYESVYNGLWGFNGYLTGASLGGSFLVLNGQTAAAACVAIVLTGLMQHVLQIIFLPTGLPVGTIPFVLTTWLFIGLGKVSDGTFAYPITISSPEKQRQDYLAHRRLQKLEQMCEATESGLLHPNGKTSAIV